MLSPTQGASQYDVRALRIIFSRTVLMKMGPTCNGLYEENGKEHSIPFVILTLFPFTFKLYYYYYYYISSSGGHAVA
jgi:hypothetical protein